MRALPIASLLIVVALVAWPSPAVARIKLAAQPARERVEILVDHHGATLVEEERIVPLLRSTIETGNNFVDFAWANTRIRKDSILFRPLAIRDGDRFRPIREVFGEAGVWAGFGPCFRKRIGGSEEIEMLLRRYSRVPIEKTWTFDWYAHGPLDPDKPFASRVLMHYEIENDEEHGLGAFPFQPGKVRIFVADGRGGEAFLGKDWARLTSIDDAMRIYLGEARDVVCTWTIQENNRHVRRGNLFDQELRIRYELENFKDRAVTLDVVEQVNRLGSSAWPRPSGRQPRGTSTW